MSDKVHIKINGRGFEVPAGSTVAAAIFMNGQGRFRTSVTGQPRAALCGMGICFECRVTIDNRLDARSCQVLVHQGMVVSTS